MPESTLPEETSLERLRRARAIRRVGLSVMVALVVLGLAGYTGQRIVTVSAETGGWTLEVRHMGRSRAGMPADMRIVVGHEGGFDGPITLAVSAAYLELLDDHGLMPEPSASTADDRSVEMEFDPPTGDTLQILYKGRIGPDAHRGRDGVVAVLEAGTPVVSVDISTAVLP